MGQTTVSPVRIIAPDLARGLALLGIAWANISTGWTDPIAREDLANVGDPATIYGGIGTHQTLDSIMVVLSAMFAHVRGLPMFCFLLGFGVGLISNSLWRRGYTLRAARRVLVKRYLWLAAFGAAHMLLLFWGDIMLTYGLGAVIVIVLMSLNNRRLLTIAAVLYTIHIVSNFAIVFVDFDDATGVGASGLQANVASYYTLNATVMLSTPLMLIPLSFSLVPLMIVGFVAARAEVHKNVVAYRRQLRMWLYILVIIIVCVGLPMGLSAVGVIPIRWHTGLMAANQALGYLTGPGIVAAIALASQGLQARVEDAAARGESVTLPWYLRAPIALGKRSMSGYVMQSVLFYVMCLPFTFNIGSEWGAAGEFLLALGVWLVTVVGAVALEKMNLRGPLEVVHRRLAYGPNGLSNPSPEDRRELECA